jgi:L-rhamnose mutarotase
MRYFGTVIKLKPEYLDEYKRYHAAVWPEIVALGKQGNIRNQTIFYRDGYLFRYFEYVGDDYEADMAKLASHPKNQEWQRLMMRMLEPVETAGTGETWAEMEEIGHWE